MRNQLVAVTFLLTLGSACCLGQDNSPIQVPVRPQETAPVLTNGHFGPGEWDQAESLKKQDSVVVLLIQDSHFLYVGIRFLGAIHSGVDLYMAGLGQRPKKLHVSSALGESECVNGVWGEIQWGKNALWTCNSIGLISDEGTMKVLPLEGFEFQISKSMFAEKSFRLFLHLKRPDLTILAGSTAQDIDSWLEIRM